MSDFDVRVERACGKLPLQQLIEQYGDGPKNANWKSFRCPFCGHKSGGVHTKAGPALFLCFHTDCPTGRKSMDQIGYIEARRGISRGDACMEFLRMADEWQESTRAPSVLPGQKRRKTPPPHGAPSTAAAEKKPDAALLPTAVGATDAPATPHPPLPPSAAASSSAGRPPPARGRPQAARRPARAEGTAGDGVPPQRPRRRRVETVPN
jgi:hypothetical protein